MTITQLRTVLGALVAISGLVAACARKQASQPEVVGPRLGESTASGPDNPSVPPPDAAGVGEAHSGPITGTAGPTLAPAPTTLPQMPADDSDVLDAGRVLDGGPPG
ncbi:MAG: hypothetical protein H6Q90_5004 [Deltaproteobacteria bacterium]|nr:hypothetical protein [Deltaproteobacteria bacterium]